MKKLIFALLMIMMISSVSAYKTYEYYKVGADDTQPVDKSIHAVAQSFRVGTVGANETFVINSVLINATEQNPAIPAKIFGVYIFAVNYTGQPIGDPLAYNSSIPTDYFSDAGTEQREIVMIKKGTLAKGKDYAVVLNSTSTGGGDSRIRVAYDQAGATYTGGTLMSSDCDDGINCAWTVVAGADMYFNITGNPGVLDWAENSQTYQATVVEGGTGTFILNMTYNNTRYPNIAGYLYWNGTKYTGTKAGGSQNITFTKSLNMPSISANRNINFYWEVQLINSTTTKVNSTSHTQTIQNLNLDSCGAYPYLLMNMTLKNEETQNLINGVNFNSSIEIDIDLTSPGSSVPIIEYSTNKTGVNNLKICSQNSLNGSGLNLDAVIRYDADQYAEEFYNIQSYIITNTSYPIQINLFDLKDADSTTFLITFKGETFLPVSNAIIDITRKYISEGVFKTVEVPITDTDGKAKGHFDTEGAIYTILVSKNGELLATFDNIAVACQDVLTEDCRLELSSPGALIPVTNFTTAGNLTYTMGFDETTRTVTVTFTTTDGGVKTVLLNTTKYDRFGNNSVCYDTLTSSAGTLTCVVPASYGNLTVISELFSNGALITRSVYSISEDAREYFGDDGIIFVLILLITLPLIAVSSPIAMVILMMVGIIVAGILGLVTSGSVFGVGSAIIWLIISGGIIIWKLSRRER